MDYRLTFGKDVLMSLATCATFLFPLGLDDVHAQSAEANGKEVVEAVCAECHRTGEKGAPKIGDRSAWAELAQRGLNGLTRSALSGIRDMPEHGGDPALSDIEIGRAIAYMVNQSGGEWVEPATRVTPAMERKAQQIVQNYCAQCHETGVGGAPKIGEFDDWLPRLERAGRIDSLVHSAIRGYGPMPARSGVADLTDSEIRAATIYMYNPDHVFTGKPPGALPTISDRNYAFKTGMDIFLGVRSADSIRTQYPEGSAERLMHGGLPEIEDFHHVNISIFDARTGTPIEDAKVRATVKGSVGSARKDLKFMPFQDMKSYGNYFRMPTQGSYLITVEIQVPGAPQATVAAFEYER